MACKEGIHPFKEQMFNDFLFVLSTRNKTVNKTVHALMELIIKCVGGGRREERVNRGYICSTSVGDKW